MIIILAIFCLASALSNAVGSNAEIVEVSASLRKRKIEIYTRNHERYQC